MTHYFWSHWNDYSRATETLPFEKSIFFRPVHFLHPKTRRRAATMTEKNDEGHGDAEWHLQGHGVTKLCCSDQSKQFSFGCRLVLIRIFLLFLLLFWSAVSLGKSFKWKISNGPSENKHKGMHKYLAQACEAWCWFLWHVIKRNCPAGTAWDQVWSGWKLSLEHLLSLI